MRKIMKTLLAVLLIALFVVSVSACFGTTKTLDSIEVIGDVSATNFVNADNVDLTGTVVMANFSDGTSAKVTATNLITNWDEIKGTAGAKTLTINYTVGNVTKTVTITVNVTEQFAPPSATLTGITIEGSITAPNYVNFVAVDLTGITVTATYSDNTTKNVAFENLLTNWEDVKTSAGTKTLIVSFTENTIVKSATVSITVIEEEVHSVLASISTEGSITATNYVNADSVDLTGLTVTAYYDSGTSQTLALADVTTNWNDIKGNAGTKTLQISFTENGVTKSATVPITITEQVAPPAATLTGITVTGSITATNYVNADSVDLTGLTVTANYSDSTNTPAPLTAITTNWNDIKGTAGTKTLQISFTENGVTKTATVSIAITQPSGTHVTATDHADADANGICDGCGASVVVEYDFYAFNDLHGKFLDDDTQPGLDELTTYLKGLQTTDDYYMYLSTGDMWQGGAESNLTKGRILTDWMSELGFSAMTLGNHEFDWTDEYIIANGEIAEFPILAINVYDKTTNQRASYCKPSVTVEVDGIKIGIIGAIGDVYSSISASCVQNVVFKTGTALTNLVVAEAQKLRNEGVDFIVYSVHDGYSNYDINISNYVDLVFEGHTHTDYITQDSKGVYHLQAGGYNQGIAHVEIALNYVTDTYVINQKEVIYSSVYGSSAINDDPIIDELLEKYSAEISKAHEVLGNADDSYGSSQLSLIVAQLYYEAGVEKWGSQYDIVLGGSQINVRSPYEIYYGQVKYSDVLALFPFDNRIALCSISGSNLKTFYGKMGKNNYYGYHGSYGSTVLSSIDTVKTYYVISDTWSSDYAANNLTVVAYLDNVTYARDLLAQYIREGGLGSVVVTKTLSSLSASGSITATNYVNANTVDLTGITLTKHYSDSTNGNVVLSGITTNWDDIKATAGTKTLTIYYIESGVTKSTTVLITVSERPAVTITSIADILTIGAALADNEVTTEYYYVRGIVTNIASTIYGNPTIEDANGDSLYSYGMADEEGNRYDALSVQPGVGDTVTLYGRIKKYQGNVQLFNGVLVEDVSAPVVNVDIPHVMGIDNDWTTGLAMTANPNVAGEYVYANLVMEEGDKFKVKVGDDGWYNTIQAGVNVGQSLETGYGNIILPVGTYNIYFYTVGANANTIYIEVAE